MKLGGFKLGKSKDGKVSEENAQVKQINNLQEQLKGSANNLKQTEAQLKKLSSNGKNSNAAATPHGPIGELSLAPEELDLDKISLEEEEKAAAAAAAEPPKTDDADGIKLVEVKINPDAPPAAKEKAALASAAAGASAAPAAAPEAKADLSSSLQSLFAQDDEEENPLASLIRSMPNVGTDELMEDIKEIKDIIKDWQKK